MLIFFYGFKNNNVDLYILSFKITSIFIQPTHCTQQHFNSFLCFFQINLELQLSYFEEVEKKLEQQLGDAEAKNLLSKSVYLFSIGGNDYITITSSVNKSNVITSSYKKKYMTMVLGNFTTVFKLGLRSPMPNTILWINNTSFFTLNAVQFQCPLNHQFVQLTPQFMRIVSIVVYIRY